MKLSVVLFPDVHLYRFCHSIMTIYIEKRGDNVSESEECQKCYGCCCRVYGEIVLKDGEARRIADYLEIPAHGGKKWVLSVCANRPNT